jgi:hypothetical protein
MSPSNCPWPNREMLARPMLRSFRFGGGAGPWECPWPLQCQVRPDGSEGSGLQLAYSPQGNEVAT